MRTWIPMFFVAALAVSVCQAQTAAEDAELISSGDEQAIRAASASYVEAVNAGEVDAVVAHWAEDADYVTETGEKISGRAALKAMFDEYLPAMEGKTLNYDVKSLRIIAPGVALEDGVATVTSGEGDQQHSAARYSAIWKLDGDKWLISSMRELGEAVGVGTQGVSPLGQLDWLLGDWHSAARDVEVSMSCTMALEGKFLKQKYEVKPEGGEPFTVVTMIGWDPTNEQLRSWYFDSQGGFGDGFWTRDGDSWSVISTGATADGRLGTATNLWKYLDDGNIVWQSKDRYLEGTPLPETEVGFTRAKAEGTK